jgi:hypothetical protein
VKRRLKPVEWNQSSEHLRHVSNSILRRNISSQSWLKTLMFIFISSRKSFLSWFQLLTWLVNNVQIVYCIVNYGVVSLPGVVSLMSTTREKSENCIKGKSKGDRSQSSEHLRPGNSCILRRITRSQSRVNILYFYVEFCINLYFFLFDHMTYGILSS